jgi:hypothetical protein
MAAKVSILKKFETHISQTFFRYLDFFFNSKFGLKIFVYICTLKNKGFNFIFLFLSFCRSGVIAKDLLKILAR